MRDHTLRDRGELTFHDVLLGAALVPALVLLAVPFVPIPGDHETEMKVKVSDGDDNLDPPLLGADLRERMRPGKARDREPEPNLRRLYQDQVLTSRPIAPEHSLLPP